MKLNLNLIALVLILLNYSCSKSTSSSGTSSSGTTTPPVDSIAKSLKVGLVAWYPFTGNALDSSGSGNHGTPYGVELTADRFGNYNNAYYFDGTGYISLLASPIKKNVDYTVCAWMKTNKNNIKPLSIIACYDTTEYDSSYLKWNHIFVGALLLVQYGKILSTTPYHEYSASNNVSDGFWHLIGITDTAGKRQLFIDGIPVGAPDTQLRLEVPKSINPNSRLTFNCNKASIGAHFPNPPFVFNYYYFGSIDDIRIWNRKLSLTEMLYLYTYK
jgi:hypothetical protein